MRNQSKIVIGVAAGVLASALFVARAGADQGMMQTQRTSPTTSERTSSQTFVVSGIDRSKRTVTLTNAEGERNTMGVGPDIKAYETLKVGDRVDVDYKESVAVSLAPTGTKPSITEKTSGSHMSGSTPGMASSEMTVAAEVVSVDVHNNKVAFKGPKGNIKTITVDDPALQKKLPNLRPGQVVQFTYTEAMAASIRPAPSK
jgi:hypothetical protein